MKKLLYSLSVLLLGACASTGEDSTMSAAELGECLQPNRRVVVEVVGRTIKPPAKKPAAKPGEAPKPQTAPAAQAAPKKPAKPAYVNFDQTAYIQGNTAFDPGSATLKDGGKEEIDKLLANLAKRKVMVGSIIVAGHTDRLEAAAGNKGLSEQRAKAVTDYIASKSDYDKLIFWEGKEASSPVPVTKFCM